MTNKMPPPTTGELADIASKTAALVEPLANPSWATLQLARSITVLLTEVRRLRAHAEEMAEVSEGCEHCYDEAVLEYRKDYPKEEA